MSLTDEEVAWVMAAPKEVDERPAWTLLPGMTPQYECIFPVRVPTWREPGAFALAKVEATSNRHRARCAFVYKDVCIRRWESSGPHRNPDGELIPGQHKHGWDEAFGDRWAYVPDDIDTATRDTMLMSFLGECGITMEESGGYPAALQVIEE